MTVDFIKSQTRCQKTINHFENHTLLLWVSETEKLLFGDIEIITTHKIKKYKGIYFAFHPNRLDIYFKPHYYFNNNLHNANDFYVRDCIKTILEFREIFEIDLLQLKIVNIEFGVNIIAPVDVKDLLDLIIYHDKNKFHTDVGLPYSKRSYKPQKDGTANEYKIIKAYAKGIQQPEYCNKNTFRFEVKSKESKYINQLGIHTLNDLLKKEVYNKLAEKINEEFNKLLILDTITNFKNLNVKDQKTIEMYNNPLVWNKIIKNPYRNNFCNHKNTYLSLINKVEHNLKNQMQKLISEKLDTLKKGAISTANKKTKYVQFPLYISVETAQNNTKHFLN